ncbi:MAG: hypothetical protein J6W40_02135 [Alphaproteobacteria bacterium]|nr:hypothetical protein [Alphaproteobacteria bacterium]
MANKNNLKPSEVFDKISAFVQAHPDIDPEFKKRFLARDLSNAEIDHLFDKYVKQNPELFLASAGLDATPEERVQIISMDVVANEQDILNALTDPKEKNILFGDFYNPQNKYYLNDDIFSFAISRKETSPEIDTQETVRTAATTKFRHTIVANRRTFIERRSKLKRQGYDLSLPDLSNFIILCDIDLSGYKSTTAGFSNEEILKVLPFAVIGKLDCSGWDLSLFNQIEKLPYAETIDCSGSIKDLSFLINADGGYKIPNGLRTLIVQDSIINEPAFSSGKKDYQTKRTLAHALLDAHPDLNIIATERNGKEINLREVLATVEKREKLATEKIATKPKETKVEPAPASKPKELTPVLSENDIPINAAANKLAKVLIETPEIAILRLSQNELIQLLRNIFKSDTYERRSNPKSSEVVNCLSAEYVNDTDTIKTALLDYIHQYYPEKFGPELLGGELPGVTIKRRQTPTPSQKEATETEKQRTGAKTQDYAPSDCKILIYISTRILNNFTPDEQEELREAMRQFNVHDQPPHASCFYVEDGNPIPLTKLQCKNKQTFSWGGKKKESGNKRIVFKSTKLVDKDGKLVLDENGKPTYVIVSYKYFAVHNTERSEKAYKECVNNEYIRVSTADKGHDPVHGQYVLSRLNRGKDYEKFEYPKPETKEKTASKQIESTATTETIDTTFQSVVEIAKQAKEEPENAGQLVFTPETPAPAPTPQKEPKPAPAVKKTKKAPASAPTLHGTIKPIATWQGLLRKELNISYEFVNFAFAYLEQHPKPAIMKKVGNDQLEVFDEKALKSIIAGLQRLYITDIEISKQKSISLDALRKLCQDIINDKNVGREVATVWFTQFNNVFIFKQKELDDFFATNGQELLSDVPPMTVDELKTYVMERLEINQATYKAIYDMRSMADDAKWFTCPRGQARRFITKYQSEFLDWFRKTLTQYKQMQSDSKIEVRPARKRAQTKDSATPEQHFTLLDLKGLGLGLKAFIEAYEIAKSEAEQADKDYVTLLDEMQQEPDEEKQDALLEKLKEAHTKKKAKHSFVEQFSDGVGLIEKLQQEQEKMSPTDKTNSVQKLDQKLLELYKAIAGLNDK